MKWEDLKVYNPLKKEDIKIAYKDFTKIIANNLKSEGFELKGRKLIKQSNDLFHIIHLDTRGSWMGTSDSFKTEISICSVHDTEIFILNYELSASRKIESLVPKIRNYYRISQEYILLAEYLTRKIKEYILPYFSKYKSSKDIISSKTKFKIDDISENIERNSNLVLYCELANHKSYLAHEILTKRIKNLQKIKPESPNLEEYKELLNLISQENWKNIDKILESKKEQVFKKLKIK